MKKLLLLLLPLLLLLQVGKAQVPQYSRNGGTTANAMPFNSATNRQQMIMLPRDFQPQKANKVWINRIYFRSATSIPATTLTNLMLVMDSTTKSVFTGLTSWVILGDTVLKAATYNIPATAAGNWISFPLQKPFYYDSAYNMIIDASASAVTNGFSIYQTGAMQASPPSPPAARRLTGTVGTTTASVAAGYQDFGFDFSIPNDAGISSVVSPVTSNVCAGSQSIQVQLFNYGSKKLNNVQINWMLDGVLQSSIPYSTPLDSMYGATANTATITLGNVVFSNKATHTFKVWTSQPNGIADTANNNDTLSFSIATTLPSGIYTIGPSGADYATIAAAVSDLNTYGICGPVIFNIATGTYTEQATLNNIPGANNTNTVTFRPASGNLGDVTMQFAPTGTVGVLNFAGTSYVTLKKLILTNTSSTTFTVTQWTGKVSNNTLDSCRLIASTASGASGNVLNASSALDAGSGGNTIRYSRVQGGAYGIYYNGGDASSSSSSCIFDYDTVVNQYTTAMRISYVDNAKIRNNIVNQSTAYTSCYGIFAGNCTGAYEIIGNNISVTSKGSFGISVGNDTSLIGQYGYVVNNTILVGSLTDASPQTTYGIYMNGGSLRMNIFNNTIAMQSSPSVSSSNSYGMYISLSSFINIYNNTVVNNTVNTATTANISNYAIAILNAAPTTNIDVKNNIFRCNVKPNATTGAMIITVPGTVTTDYNSLYSAGTNLITTGVSGSYVQYNSLAAWRATGSDAHSIAYRNSGLMSTTDLRPNPADTSSWSLNGRGIQIDNISYDINNATRSTTLAAGAPDLGAYEFTPTSVPPKDSAVPAAPVANSTQYFTFGGDTVASIAWGSTVPSTVVVRQYSGTTPPSYTGDKMDFYVDVTGTSGTYNYTMKTWYRRPWLRGVAMEKILRMIKGDGLGAWLVIDGTASSADTVVKIITAPAMTTLGQYSGSKTLIVPVVGPITGTLVLCKGSTSQLADTSINGTWSSATPSVATISSTGLVTAVGVGTSIISYAAPAGTVTATVTVNDTPTVAAITGATHAICQGQTLQLGNTTSGGVWSSVTPTIASVNTTGLVTASTTLFGGTTIKYTVTNSSSCSTAANYILTVNQKPAAPSAITGIAPLCQGQSAILTSTPANGLWSSSAPTIADVDPISGVVTASATNTGNATITYSVTNVNNCSNSITAILTVNGKPTAIITPDVTSRFCEGDSVTFKVTAVTGATYQWLNGTPVAGETNDSLKVKTAGNYGVEVTNATGCKDTSVVDTVIVFPLPNPVVGYTKPTLSTGSFSTYQWYKDGQPISGATNQSHTATENGDYYVVVTDANGCSKQSVVTTVSDIVGVRSVTAIGRQVRIYPNPAMDIVQINAPVAVNITISGVDGKVLMQEKSATQINISNLPDALYLIHVYDLNGQLLKVEKLIKAGH